VDGIRFDTFNCLLELSVYIMSALKKIQKVYMDDARAGMKFPRAREELTAGELEVLSGRMAITVIGGPWVAMDEYGTGSLMDADNPAYEDYVNSFLFNPLRRRREYGLQGYPKVGRPKGSYVDIFGRTMHSSGKFAGLDLERLAERGVLPKTFLATPPTKALRTAARWMQNGEAVKILQETLATFPWGKFFVVTKD